MDTVTSQARSDKRTVHRSCTLCEAACGLTFEVANEAIVAVKPDHDDVFSRGHICPKGAAIAAVHDDPDRLRRPMKRAANGAFEPISWDEAFDLVASRLNAIREAHGPDAIGIYVGNPIVHNTGAIMLYTGFLRALRTKNSFSAGSQDTATRNAASFYLYGSSWAVPVPDLDRTDHLLCIGANPHVSNGSFLSSPHVRERLRAIRRRGGKVVVVDPRRSETARDADEHVSILPGGDAALLLSMVHCLARDGRIDPDAVAVMASGWETLEPLLDAFAPERAAPACGVDAETIERLAREFADAKTATAYSRIGVCNNRYGTLASFATDLLNLVTGRLGAIGGAMFAESAVDMVQVLAMSGSDGHARWKSRVRGLPETFGALPSAVMAEEIETPGHGQIRAMITFAGNPVLSTPNGRRLERALRTLDFMVAIDLYVNETTRHADVILPPAWALAEDHLEVMVSNFAVRNFARWSPAVVAKRADERADWEILLELAERLGGGPTGIGWMDRLYAIGKRFGRGWNPAGTGNLLLRLGPYGDRFLPWSKGLNARKLRAAEHGIDLGPLRPGILRRVLHEDGLVHLAAEPILAQLRELRADLSAPRSDELLLIGRRETRTNNSWMHNVAAMVSGRERCVLLVHPDDAARIGVADGERAVLASRIHQGEVRVRVSDEMRPGVVSLPHGWGHAAAAPWQRVAGAHPGVSINDWTDDAEVESVVGQSILNGVRVRLARAARAEREPEAAVA